MACISSKQPADAGPCWLPTAGLWHGTADRPAGVRRVRLIQSCSKACTCAWHGCQDGRAALPRPCTLVPHFHGPGVTHRAALFPSQVAESRPPRFRYTWKRVSAESGSREQTVLLPEDHHAPPPCCRCSAAPAAGWCMLRLRSCSAFLSDPHAVTVHIAAPTGPPVPQPRRSSAKLRRQPAYFRYSRPDTFVRYTIATGRGRCAQRSLPPPPPLPVPALCFSPCWLEPAPLCQAPWHRARAPTPCV